MHTVLKALHALSAALLFGSVAFFTVAGLLIFEAFADEAKAGRLPLPAKHSPAVVPEGFPSPPEEQGSRMAGVAVGRIFPVYFALQGGCAVLALVTVAAMGGRLRLALCIVVLLSVLAGWGLARHVSALREKRAETTDAVLTDPGMHPSAIEEARQDRRAFGLWHSVSLLANFTTLGLSAWLAALVAFPRRPPLKGVGLPDPRQSAIPPEEPRRPIPCAPPSSP
jgi:hypothetical protein